jgi:hypothetical protein
MNRQPLYHDDCTDSTPLPRFDLIDRRDAKRRAFTAFIRGSIFGAILATGAFIASAAMGETISIGRMHINGELTGSTTVTLAPSSVPGQLATVTMDNRLVNQGSDTGTYFLTMEGLTIEADFTWDFDPVLGSDRITVYPPDGIVCDPVDCAVTVPEGLTGTIVLYDWRGM